MTVKRIHAEMGTAIGTAALGLIAVIGASQLGFGWGESGPQPGYFPFWVGLILMAASLWNLGAAFLRHRAAMADVSAEPEAPFLPREHLERIARFTGTMLAFVIATLTLGIYVGGTGYIAYSAWRQGKYRWPVALGIGVAFSVVQFVVFEMIFKIPLLKGPIEPLLGIY